MNHSARAADEQHPVQHGRLRERCDVAVERERPFQLESSNGIGRQAGHIAGLEASVRVRWTPTVPLCSWSRRDLDGAVRTEGGRWRRRVGGCRRSNVRGNGLTLLAAQGIGDAHHGAEIECSKNPSCGHLLQRVAMRDSRTHEIVAAGAALAVDGLARHLRRCRRGAFMPYEENKRSQRKRSR